MEEVYTGGKSKVSGGSGVVNVRSVLNVMFNLTFSISAEQCHDHGIFHIFFTFIFMMLTLIILL